MDASKLNDEQKLAVFHRIGHPAAVIAGAGSGKTRVLTTRISHLIENEGVPSRRVLALTFTNKAAGEIRERLGYDEHEGPRIGTIHSLALSAIRRAPKGFGLNDKVTPLDEYDQREMIKRLIDASKLEEVVNPYKLMEKVSYHRARGIGFSVDYTPDVAAKAAIAHGGYHSLISEELEIWSAFEKEKKINSVVDFDDMIHLVVRRGREDEKWLKGLQRLFDHVLQDEAQDTNVIQWDFINMLLPPDNLNMFCVGDPNQSIYGFNGAAPEIIVAYAKEWRSVEPSVYKLQQNYRSVPEVVKLANKTQLYMTDTIPLTMQSNRGKNNERGRILLRRSGTPRELAASISEEIANRDRIDYKDIAILIRAGSQVRDIETELVRNRIPYIIRGTMGLLQTEEVKDILSYLKIASNPQDFSAFCRSTGIPKRGVGEAALKQIHELAVTNDGDLIKTLNEVGHRKLSTYVRLIESIRALAHDPSEAIDYLLGQIKYEDYLKNKYKKYPERIEIKQTNIFRLKEMIRSLMNERDLTIDDVVFQLTMQDQKDVNTGGGKVVISTIHASKGLEWHTVYLMNLYEGSVPHKWCTSEAEISEERRLFYVGCTRAKDTLVLGVPATIEYYNKGVQFVAPSRFLTELEIC